MSAKECDGLVVARGKNGDKKRCWKANGEKWEEQKNTTKCKSWTNYVNWKHDSIKAKASGRPYARVDGWKRKADKNFKGTDYLWDEKLLGYSKKCAEKCDNDKKCVGFVFNKNESRCWGVGVDRVDAGLKGEKGMYAFVKQGTNVSSGGGGSTETTGAGTSSAGKYKGSGKNEKAREGNFFFRVKGGQTSAVIGSKDSYTYIKFNAVESKGGCDNSNDNRQIIVASDTKGKTAADASGQYQSYMIWGLRPAEGGGGKWRIFNQAHLDANCGYNRLSTDYNAQNANCETQGRKVMFSSWGDWYLFPSGKGYKFRATNCGPEGKGAWLYIGESGADMTSEQNATTIYLEKAIAA